MSGPTAAAHLNGMSHPEYVEEIRAHIAYKTLAGELDRAVAQRMQAALDDGAAPDWAALLEQATFPPLPATCFHTAPVTARDQIRGRGLIPADPAFGRHGVNAVGQPIGVYVAAEPDLIGRWSDDQVWDVWQVDTTGLPFECDLLNPGCWILPAVERPRLTLLHRDLTYPPTESL